METISLKGIVSFFILGRKWTDGNGNTYFANKIYISGEDIQQRHGLLHCTRWSYGYGEQWREDAAFHLMRYLTAGEEGHDLRALRKLCEDKNILLITDCAIVSTKKELRRWTSTIDSELLCRSYNHIPRPVWTREVCRAL